MEDLTLTTPTLLFSAVSLILLAYTNRFLGYAQLIRGLYAQFKKSNDTIFIGQIRNLRERLRLIRLMQMLGVLSLLLCVADMFLIYIGAHKILINWVFGVGLLSLILSLAVSIWEIRISTVALNMHLNELETKDN